MKNGINTGLTLNWLTSLVDLVMEFAVEFVFRLNWNKMKMQGQTKVVKEG